MPLLKVFVDPQHVNIFFCESSIIVYDLKQTRENH